MIKYGKILDRYSIYFSKTTLYRLNPIYNVDKTELLCYALIDHEDYTVDINYVQLVTEKTYLKYKQDKLFKKIKSMEERFKEHQKIKLSLNKLSGATFTTINGVTYVQV